MSFPDLGPESRGEATVTSASGTTTTDVAAAQMSCFEATEAFVRMAGIRAEPSGWIWPMNEPAAREGARGEGEVKSERLRVGWAASDAGLRVAEVSGLKVSDIDSERMLLRVERGKGGQYRNAMLSADMLALLRQWWKVGRQQGVMHAKGWLRSRPACRQTDQHPAVVPDRRRGGAGGGHRPSDNAPRPRHVSCFSANVAPRATQVVNRNPHRPPLRPAGSFFVRLPPPETLHESGTAAFGGQREEADIQLDSGVVSSSMSVEDALIGGICVLDRLALCRRRIVGILGRWQAAEAHEARHQQKPRLGRGQVRSAR